MKKGHVTLSLQVCNDLVLNRKTSNLFWKQLSKIEAYMQDRAPTHVPLSDLYSH